jgi:hypothetical protein
VRPVADDATNEGDLSNDFLDEHGPADPRFRRLHRGVRLDPESVWDDLKDYLCSLADPDQGWADDLIEDLMFWHADAFIERLETLVAECPRLVPTVEWAVVEGVAGDGVDRFHALQARLEDAYQAQEKDRLLGKLGLSPATRRTRHESK